MPPALAIAASARPIGSTTRGTTHPNRLRRFDRWLLATQAWRLRAEHTPILVDVGFGASPVTTAELAQRVAPLIPQAHVIGLEIDAGRAAEAAAWARTRDAGVQFGHGGFETPLPAGRRASLIRACNVLRQYDVSHVDRVWSMWRARLAPHGLAIDGTCDEVGRRCAWVAMDRSGPLSLTLSLRLAGLVAPSEVAPRLPKALIHRNVPGERVHSFLSALDHAWLRHAPLAAFGRRQRFHAAAELLAREGWPVLGGPRRWREGEITVAWEAVQPVG